MAKTRNRKAQDATLININSLKRQVRELKTKVVSLESWVTAIEFRLSQLEPKEEEDGGA